MSQGEGPQTGGRPDRAALLLGVALSVTGVAIITSTMNMPGVTTYSPVGPKIFPYIVASGLVILGLLTLVSAWKGDFPEREPQRYGPMLWIVGGLVVQLLTMKTVGFSIATGLLFAATARGFGRGPLWMTIPIGIVFSFVIWFIFSQGLQLTLPEGPIERLF